MSSRISKEKSEILNFKSQLRKSENSNKLRKASSINNKPVIAETLIDISSQKENETASNKVQIQFQEIFRNSPSAMGIIDLLELKYFDVNPSFEKMTGYSRDEIINQKIEFDTISANKNKRESIIAHIKKHKSINNVEYEIINKNGELRELIMSISSFKEDTRRLGIINAIDVTDRKKNENYYKSLFKGSRDGIVFVDKDGKVLQCNESYCNITGYTAEEMKNIKLWDITPLKYHDWEKAEIFEKQLFTRGYSDIYEKEYIHKNGNLIPIELQAYQLNKKKRDGVYWAVVRDVSERKLLEKEVRQSQKMEALGTIAGGIAHDLNNVVGAMMGFNDLVRDDVMDGIIPNLSHVNRIGEACNRAAGIINQILMFSRREETKKTAVGLYSITRDVLKLIEHTIPKTIRIHQDLRKSKYMVLADINQLHQIFINLCTNAWHSMRNNDSGDLYMSIKTVEVFKHQIPLESNCSGGIYECAEVRDTGKGIEEENLEKIFNPFFTTKSEGEGTGLGLAVLKKILAEHKGFVTVKSKLNVGTSFKVYLPVTSEGKINLDRNDKESLEGGNETILIVDDETPLREALIIKLKRLGYNTISAANGQEGLSLYIKNKAYISLIITDLGMPKMNGVQMINKIRKINKNVIAILFTGYSETLNLNQIPNDLFQAFLRKPLQRINIAKTIRKILNKEELTKEDIDV